MDRNYNFYNLVCALLSLLLFGAIVSCVGAPASTGPEIEPGIKGQFNAERAMSDVKYQLSLGARTPGSKAHRQIVEWMVGDLTAAGWDVEIQETSWMGHPVRNVIAKWGQGNPWIILGAHYDTRFVADQDPDPAKRTTPVPGANDGASGVAVLLEIARTLPARMAMSSTEDPSRTTQVWLVFFDAEDQGRIDGWDWILGSRAFVSDLEIYPDAAVIVDMIGDEDLNVYMEKNSDANLTNQIWSTASELGYSSSIIQEYRHRMLDDHIPFQEIGIPAVDLIDFDYPYWHTVADTADKVSSNSLTIIGETLLTWLVK